MQARYPVVENVLGPGRFVANDAELGSNSGQLGVITGPNMAGKSTYIRQVALAVILPKLAALYQRKRPTSVLSIAYLREWAVTS